MITGVSFTHCEPLYFKYCPELTDVTVASDKSFTAPNSPTLYSTAANEIWFVRYVIDGSLADVITTILYSIVSVAPVCCSMCVNG